MSEQNQTKIEEESPPNLEGEPNIDYPPETFRLLSWSSIRFIRSPSSEFLMWSIIAIALTCVMVIFLSSLIKMDVTVRGPGEIVSDFGSRDAMTQSAGVVMEIRKNIGDKVRENDVIALLKIDAGTESKIADAVVSLQNLEKKIRIYQNSKNDEFEFDQIVLPKTEAGPALDAIINFEQQAKYYADLRMRSKTGLDNELRPLRQRATLLDAKIKKMKGSSQAQLLGQFLETTEEELGRIRSQISTTENESKLKADQGMGDFIKSIEAVQGALQNYLDQKRVKAPISGVIGDIFTRVNVSIDTNKPLARVLPENSQFMAAIHLYSKDIVKVFVGQPTLFKIEAYPYQTYGSFTGKVIYFEQAKDAAAALGDYTVYSTVEFPSQLSKELKEKMRLIVGMKLNAEIVVDRKSGSSIMKKMVFEKH